MSTNKRGQNKSGGPKGQGGYKENQGKQAYKPNQKYTNTNPIEIKSKFQNVKVGSVKVEDLPELKNVEANSCLSESKEPGKYGTIVKLKSNYFPLSIPTGPFFQYSVHIKPKVDNPNIANRLIKNISKSFGEDNTYVFDGNGVLYTQKHFLSEDQKFIEVYSKDKTDEKYQIKVQYACLLSSDAITQEVKQLFNIMYRRALVKLKLQQIGRYHFSLEQAIKVDKYNLSIAPGLLETIYITDRGIFLNADVIFRSLRTDTLLDLLREYKKNHKDWKVKFEAVVTNTIVICRYNQRNVYINGVDFKLSPQSTFQKNGKHVSYAKYFEEQYNSKISDMNQPLLFSKKKNSNEVQYFIPELCNLTGLTEEMRNDSKIMKDLKKITALTPDERCKQIASFVQESLQNKEFKQELESWDFKLDERIVEISGRVLPTEKILFGKKFVPTDDKRQWNIRSDAIHKGVTISNWVCFYPEKSKDHCDQFLKCLYLVSKPLDIKFQTDSLKLVPIVDTSPKGYKNALEAVMNSKKIPTFALIILQDDKKERYDAIKKLLTIEFPIPSQCVKLKTVSDEKGLSSKATKIAVQIASKMGGIPWIVDIPAPPGGTMICGMDVYHSGETVSRTKPSIVGFTATTNAKMTNHYSRVLINKPGQELTDTLQPIFEDSLKEFKKQNGAFPKFIIFYRDGVGEGQLKELLDKEVANLEKCLKNLKIDNCKITFIVVVKRIHTRFFTENNNKFDNPSAGTIVDTGITNHKGLEFFLVSQSVNQGTATPVRYQCIYNTANLGIDYLEKLTFKLCHMYFNWFGTIKVPSVCLYAHKIAFLVGQSTGNEDKQLRLSDSLYYL